LSVFVKVLLLLLLLLLSARKM